MFAAALLGALIRQEGGTVSVSEDVYRQEAHRVKKGQRSRLSVEFGSEGRFIVHISEGPATPPPMSNPRN